MFKAILRRQAGGLVLALCTVALIGCGGEEPTKLDTTTLKESAKLTGDVPSVEVLTRLASFDAFDGTTDKVVWDCAGCALSMKGDSEYPVEIGEYTLHFCSGPCATKFSEASNEKILALEIPKK